MIVPSVLEIRSAEDPPHDPSASKIPARNPLRHARLRLPGPLDDLPDRVDLLLRSGPDRRAWRGNVPTRLGERQIRSLPRRAPPERPMRAAGVPRSRSTRGERHGLRRSADRTAACSGSCAGARRRGSGRTGIPGGRRCSAAGGDREAPGPQQFVVRREMRPVRLAASGVRRRASNRGRRGTGDLRSSGSASAVLQLEDPVAGLDRSTSGRAPSVRHIAPVPAVRLGPDRPHPRTRRSSIFARAPIRREDRRGAPYAIGTGMRAAPIRVDRPRERHP